jgi:hypothetical protein
MATLLFLRDLAGLASRSRTKIRSQCVMKVPRQEKNLVAAVEEMPADSFGYKPTPQQMRFARLILHMRSRFAGDVSARGTSFFFDWTGYRFGKLRREYRVIRPTPSLVSTRKLGLPACVPPSIGSLVPDSGFS